VFKRKLKNKDFRIKNFEKKNYSKILVHAPLSLQFSWTEIGGKRFFHLKKDSFSG